MCLRRGVSHDEEGQGASGRGGVVKTGKAADYGRGSWGRKEVGAIEENFGSAVREGVGLDRGGKHCAGPSSYSSNFACSGSSEAVMGCKAPGSLTSRKIQSDSHFGMAPPRVWGCIFNGRGTRTVHDCTVYLPAIPVLMKDAMPLGMQSAEC